MKKEEFNLLINKYKNEMIEFYNLNKEKITSVLNEVEKKIKTTDKKANTESLSENFSNEEKE